MTALVIRAGKRTFFIIAFLRIIAGFVRGVPSGKGIASHYMATSVGAEKAVEGIEKVWKLLIHCSNALQLVSRRFWRFPRSIWSFIGEPAFGGSREREVCAKSEIERGEVGTLCTSASKCSSRSSASTCFRVYRCFDLLGPEKRFRWESYPMFCFGNILLMKWFLCCFSYSTRLKPRSHANRFVPEILLRRCRCSSVSTYEHILRFRVSIRWVSFLGHAVRLVHYGHSVLQ